MHVARPRAHDALVERLWQAAADGRLPHAILLEGPAGIGKFVAARWFAAGLLCAEGPGEPCGTCGPCKRVASGGAESNHPDLLVIDPTEEGEEQIRIHRIAHRGEANASDGPETSVEVFLDLRPMESGFRLVLIREGHRMNAAAQNALLKTLEEPRPGTVLVLETHASESLLPTIRSRCVRIRCRALSAADCAAVLCDAGRSGEEAALLARRGEGSPGRALFLEARGVEEALAAIGGALAGSASPLATAQALWELPGAFEGKTATARARDRARFLLDLLLALFRDRLRASQGIPAEDLAHGDLVRALDGSVRDHELSRTLAELLVCRGDIDRNLMPEAVLERALLVTAEGNPHSTASR